MNTTCRIALVTIMGGLLFCYSNAIGGHPQPYEHPDLFRRANMAMLQFQEALESERWEEALSFCSSRVRQEAKEWSSLEDFISTSTKFPSNIIEIEILAKRD